MIMGSGKLLNIVFWGEDAFSCVVFRSLVSAGHQVKLVVTPRYDNLIYKRLEGACKDHDVPLLRAKKINSDEVYEAVWGVKPDLCVVAHFERLIKEPILSVPTSGFVNLHPSLLPNYRGMAPQHWPIINGEKETGITVHYVDEGVDTGDIILQRRILLTDDMYVSDLQKLWMKHYETVMVEAIDNILNGKSVMGQRHLDGSYYGKLKEEQCWINPEGSVRDAYNLVRGVSLPYFGARWGDMAIYKAHIVAADEPEQTDKPVLLFKDGRLTIDKYKVINKQ